MKQRVKKASRSIPKSLHSKKIITEMIIPQNSILSSNSSSFSTQVSIYSSSKSDDIKTLQYKNKKFSAIAFQANNKISSLEESLQEAQYRLNEVTQVNEKLMQLNEESKNELKNEKTKIMAQLEKISQNYKIYSQSHQLVQTYEKENILLQQKIEEKNIKIDNIKIVAL